MTNQLPIPNTPFFEHDCSDCVYLGSSQSGQPLDYYFCEQGGHPTVLVRYGQELSQYKSGLEFGIQGLDPDLTEALNRAIQVKRLYNMTNYIVNKCTANEYKNRCPFCISEELEPGFLPQEVCVIKSKPVVEQMGISGRNNNTLSPPRWCPLRKEKIIVELM